MTLKKHISAVLLLLSGILLSLLFPARLQAADTGTPIRIACVGDSITAGYTSSNPAVYSYPSQLQNLLGDGYTVGNYGKTGFALMKNVNKSYWGTDEHTNSLNSNPDIVVLMLGTNDSKAENWAEKDHFLSDLKEMIKGYQDLSSHPNVYVCTSPRMRDAYENMTTQTGLNNAVINNEIVPLQKQAVEETPGCRLIDVNAFSQEGFADGDFNDYCHPTNEGYQKLAKFIYDELIRQEYCTCSIEELTLTGSEITIPWNQDTAEYKLEPVCTLASCELDAHKNLEATLEFSITDTDGIAAFDPDTQTLTLSKPGRITVSVTASIPGTDITAQSEDAVFEVKKEEEPKTDDNKTPIEEAGSSGTVTPPPSDTKLPPAPIPDPPTPPVQNVKLTRPKLKVKKSGTKAKLSWKKNKKADGYQIQMKTGKGKYKKIASKKMKITSFTKKKLKKNTVYCFRMRSFKKSGSSTVYSPWSKVVKIRLS